MNKKLHLLMLGGVVLVGCTNTPDEEYNKILNHTPKWSLNKSDGKQTQYIDVSNVNNKSPFIRLKSENAEDNVQSLEIYRLDCNNHRVANYYSKFTKKSKTKKSNEDYGYSEISTESNSEDFYYNPTQPNSVNQLWRTFPIGDNIFSNHCKLKKSDTKPQNPEMPDWTYLEDLSELSFATSYVKTDQLNTLKNTGVGELSMKSFSQSASNSYSSTEHKIKIDCKARTATQFEIIRRDSDYEYAPALDQSKFAYKRVLNLKPAQLKDISVNQIDDKNQKFINILCK